MDTTVLTPEESSDFITGEYDPGNFYIKDPLGEVNDYVLVTHALQTGAIGSGSCGI